MRRRIPSTTMLLAFEAAGRSLSFTQAGKDLSLTQSAVSHQIQSLEETLGLRLFDRANRRLALTGEGALLLSRLAPALNALEGAILETMASRTGSGTVQLAVPPTFATKWLIPRLPSFARLHPQVSLQLVMRLDAPEPGDGLDAAIYFGMSLDGFVCEPFMVEENVVVCSPELARHLQAPGDIAQLPLLHLASRPEAWKRWAAFAGVDLDAGAGTHLELFSMVAQAAAAGLGVALLPRLLIQPELASGQLVPVFEQYTLEPEAAYHLALPPAKAAMQSVQTLRAWLLDQVTPKGRKSRRI